MTKLTSLMQYSKPLTQLLQSLPSGSWNRSSSLQTTLPPLNLDTDPRALIARWTMDVIEQLTTIPRNQITIPPPSKIFYGSKFVHAK